MAKRDYYEILGVSKDSTEAEIKSAFRKIAKKYHPDISKEAGSTEKFKEAQEAYAVLSDTDQRKKYDQYGQAAFEGAQGQRGYDYSNFDFSSIFDDLFGGASFGGSPFGGFGGNSRSRTRKGQDTLLRMNLSFEDAVFGSEKKVNLEVNEKCDECNGKGGFDEKTCPDCGGQGVVNTQTQTLFGTFASQTTCTTCKGKGKVFKTTCSKCNAKGYKRVSKDITITIPKGVDTGHQIRLSGKGELGSNGGPNGDIYIEFIVGKSKLYKRQGNDLYLNLPVTITDLVLGTIKEIKTLDGFIDLKIKEGSQPEDILRVKNKGVSDPNTSREGDLYVILKLIIPKKLNKTQKDMFNELKETKLDNEEEFKTFNKLNK